MDAGFEERDPCLRRLEQMVEGLTTSVSEHIKKASHQAEKMRNKRKVETPIFAEEGPCGGVSRLELGKPTIVEMREPKRWRQRDGNLSTL